MKRILVLTAMTIALLMQGCMQSGGPKGEKEEAEAARIYSDLGLGYLRQGSLEQALEKLKRALEIDSKYPAANHYIAEVYKQLGDTKQAEKYYDRAAELDPRNPMVLNNYGAFLCDQARFVDAEKYFLRAANTPRYQTPELAYENLALCAQRVNNSDKAEEYFRKALAANPKLSKSLYQLAQLSYDKKDHLKARAFLQRFHGVSTQSEQSLKLAIKIEQALGNETALQEYRQALKTRFPDAVTE
jgi:type IV pilus assembly protein PilF